MIDKEIHWNISLGDALLINNNELVSIPISKDNYDNIFVNKKLGNGVKELLKANELYFDSKLHDNLTKDFDFGLDISMYPNYEQNTYEIGYDINTIFRNIFNKLGLTYINKDYDFYDENDIKQFKIDIKDQLIDGQILDLLSKIDPDYFNTKYDRDMQVIFNLEKNLNKVVNQMINTNLFLHKRLKEQIKFDQEKRDKKQKLEFTDLSLIIPKNLLYYCALKSLNIFNEIGDINYYRYAKDYYLNVSGPKTDTDKKPEYPKIMIVDGKYYLTYNEFNYKFKNIQSKFFPKLYVDLGIEDLDRVSVGYTTLKEGAKRIIKPSNKGSKSKKLDFKKLQSILDKKIKFYNELKQMGIQGIIDSTQKDIDYIGYVLPNNYCILEKFYESNKDGSNIRPAYNNAVYIVTLDVLEACDFDKKKIRKYIEKNKDFKAYRKYHNDTDSYQKEVLKVLSYKPVSTRAYEDFKNDNKNN